MARHQVDYLHREDSDVTEYVIGHYWYKDEYPHEVYECSAEEWSTNFGKDERVLAKTTVGTIEVSTVFLGLGEMAQCLKAGVRFTEARQHTVT